MMDTHAPQTYSDFRPAQAHRDFKLGGRHRAPEVATMMQWIDDLPFVAEHATGVPGPMRA
jgi:hypothetical protein